MAAKSWLAFASLFFYSYWDIRYLPLLLGSIFFNYAVGTALREARPDAKKKKILLVFGISCNLLLLCYYKYLNFFIANISHFIELKVNFLKIILPLGISFFTFTQIAFLVDSFKGKVREYKFLNYILFVTYFPHLIAGPIIHHSEMMPQFDRLRNKVINWKNIYMGVFLFSMGLVKKVIIADRLALISASGFDKAHSLTFVEAWATSLSYTSQLYFDFSGYTDMALGLSLMFNIALPINFNSPYKALDIQDFWRRWHITLSRFLKEYIYIPLGGNKKDRGKTYRNILITFFLGGLWHGAGWTFIFWGILNGAAIVIHKMWKKAGLQLNNLLAWVLTFNFVNICWIFFRAKRLTDAEKILNGMAGLRGLRFPQEIANKIPFLKASGLGIVGNWNVAGLGLRNLVLILATVYVVTFCKNSWEIATSSRPTWQTALSMGIFFGVSVLNMNRISEFLYFNF